MTSVGGVGLVLLGMIEEGAPLFDLMDSRLKSLLLTCWEYLSLYVPWVVASCITGVWVMLDKFGGGLLIGEVLCS